jgi:hypothetical protein
MIPALLVAAILTSIGPSTDDRALVADFGRRIDAYMQIRADVGAVVLPIRVTADVAELQRAVDKLAIGIRVRRANALQGQVFSPDIAALFRRIIRAQCHDQFADVLAILNEDWEMPPPPAAVHGRWPDGVPLPTMPPDLLAAFPRVPPEVEYRVSNRDLVLRDIDANLIIDFIPEAIPASVWSMTEK